MRRNDPKGNVKALSPSVVDATVQDVGGLFFFLFFLDQLLYFTKCNT